MESNDQAVQVEERQAVFEIRASNTNTTGCLLTHDVQGQPSHYILPPIQNILISLEKFSDSYHLNGIYMVWMLLMIKSLNAIFKNQNMLLQQQHINLQFFCLFFFLAILGLHLWHMEVPSLGDELELQLLAYTTPTARPDLSQVCDLHFNPKLDP